jgi:hypothetical protein
VPVETSTHRYLPDGVDEQLLSLSPLAAVRALEVPTLVRVPGTGQLPPRAFACLLHGDESTGLEAALAVLRRRRQWPFDLYVLIGNVPAAAADGGFAHRYLDEQEDFNRIWGLDVDSPQRAAAAAIHELLVGAGLEALVDVHNNTGNNPFYAIVTTDHPRDYNLATLFTTTVLRWDLLVNTLMESMPAEVSAIAVECGLPGLPESRAFAVDGLRRFLGTRRFRDDRVRFDVDVYGGLVKVKVVDEVDFAFGGGIHGRDFVVADGADVVNFVEVEAGHVIGHVPPGRPLPLRAVGPDGADVTDQHLACTEDGAVVVTQPTIPVMMTRTVAAARKDVLCYLADVLPPPGVVLPGAR